MANPHYEFVINYHGLSSKQVQEAINDAFHDVDLILEEQLSGRPGHFIPTNKLLSDTPFLSRIAIAVCNTYDVTKMIKNLLLCQYPNITLVKDIKEIFI